MRVALLYPPPWKIPAPGQTPDPVDGPPAVFGLDWDFYQTPYGLFTLGAQAIRAGHEVKVINMAAFPWATVERIIEQLDADVFGMSCWTANRRGVALTAALIKQKHPGALVVVGGPHASALPEALLQHHAAFDLVCVGESEDTFCEVLSKRAQGQSLSGIAGTVYRANGRVLRAAERPSIKDLDTLASPHDYFHTHIVMTARGCPWQCTFCGAETTWGRGFRGNSVSYVLDALEKTVGNLPVKMVQIKDDTFTTNKKRVLELCRGIRKRGLRFVWSCDTRVDVLSEELLYEMRLAGCERLSLGVESGSQKILSAIDKKITVEEIIASTELAKKYGLRVRYYMMIGNRGETRETFEESLAFLERARPHQYLFTCLSIYPGTRDFDDAVALGTFDPEVYFTEKFQEYVTTFDTPEQDVPYLREWFRTHKGLQTMHVPDAEEYRSILQRLPEHAPAHMDLAGALYREKQFEEAETLVLRALDLQYALPGLAYNMLGCIAYAFGELDAMVDYFKKGLACDPQHQVLLDNALAADEWFQRGGPQNDLPLNLQASHEFHLLERNVQPTTPGPLAADWAVWKPVVPAGPVRPVQLAEVAAERRRLPTLSR